MTPKGIKSFIGALILVGLLNACDQVRFLAPYLPGPTSTPPPEVLAVVHEDWANLPAEVSGPILQRRPAIPLADVTLNGFTGLVISRDLLLAAQTDSELKDDLLEVVQTGATLIIWGANRADLISTFPELPLVSTPGDRPQYSSLLFYDGLYVPGAADPGQSRPGDPTQTPERGYLSLLNYIYLSREAARDSAQTRDTMIGTPVPGYP